MHSITEKRWFLGKGKQIRHISEFDSANIGDTALTLLQVEFTDGQIDYYTVIKDEIDLGDASDMAVNEEHLMIPKGCAVYEINGPYFFGIANKFDDLMKNIGHDKPKVRIIRMRKVPFIDSTGIHNLANLIEMNHEQGIHVILSGVTPKVHSQLKKAGFYDKMNPDHICPHIDVALAKAREFLGE